MFGVTGLCETEERPGASPARTVLLVDDSRLQRRILKVLLGKWGYDVREAGSAEEGLEVCARESIDIIISDWVMPGMNGLEFCTAFRAMARESYGFFMLLTSKSETGEMIDGLEHGADDFLTKPVNASELRARLSACERILHMEQELNEKNRIISRALEELQGLYDSIDRDLAQARKIQESLMPVRNRRFGGSEVSVLLKPCGHVGGDLVGMFSPGPHRLGFYSIDVSGHGITSALMTARLSGYLSGDFLEQNIALERRFERFFALRQPDEVARTMNERLLTDAGVEEYFTMAYGIVDLRKGLLKLVQAGHPHPALQRADGRVEFLGEGGLPVGLLPEAEYSCFEVQLAPGDRVLLYSDGFTESESPDGRMLEERGLARMLRRARHAQGPELLDDLFWQLTDHTGSDQLTDDVSAILLEFDQPG